MAGLGWTTRRANARASLWLAALAVAAAFMVMGARGALADTFTVTSTQDTGKGSLRKAISSANSRVGQDRIRFQIDGKGVKSIAPLTPLPTITDAVIVEGYSQPGAQRNTLTNGSDAVLRIQLDGTEAGTGTDGLVIEGSGVRVSGLAINRFGESGIEVSGAGASGNTIEGNFIGTNAAGNADLGNLSHGVKITGSPNNTIGGTTVGARNVISGNGDSGIEISGATGNTVAGNFIGTSDTGGATIGADGDGVRIANASGNTIGGTTVGARNVISGNGSHGVEILGAGTPGNTVQGNFIGTNAAGNADLGNLSHGVKINSGDNNTVGGQVTGARNIISGNNIDGVVVESNNNVVRGNRIGTNKNGNAAIGNAGNGVSVFGADNNIGGTLGGRNLISGNGGDGVELTGAGTGNNVLANFVGTNAAGTAALGNAGSGVLISSDNNTIGGVFFGEGNTLSGNGVNGVFVSSSGTGNAIRGNLIGTDVTGTVTDPDNTPNSGDELGNAGNGVSVFGADNAIGGTGSGAGNTISGNEDDGVKIFGSDASRNVVQGNRIGTDKDGTAALGNGGNGVRISVSADNTIGGTAIRAPNTISNNGAAGVSIGSESSTGNVVQGNRIVDNAGDGVQILIAFDNTIGGTVSGAGNTIANNGGDGVSVPNVGSAAGGTGNSFLSNSIAANGSLDTHLGIDLGPNGVTGNDTDDPDTGSNNLQNFPFIRSAVRSSTGSTTISGTLNSNPNQSFTVQCFVADTTIDNSNGEGQIPAGADTTVTTDNEGNSSTFTCTSSIPVEVGSKVTATATNTATGDTSEFSRNVAVSPAP